MKENVLEAQKRLESQIDGLKISDNEKARMRRVLKGIIESPKGRLFTQKSNSFEEYLTLRPSENSMYELCVIERMINEYSGATEGSRKTPMSLMQVAGYVREHKDVLESEVVNSENYQRRMQAQAQVQPQQERPAEPKKQKTPQEDFKDIIKATIEHLPNVPEHKKQRAIDVLEAIAVSPQSKLYSKREDGYSEAIALRGSGNQFRYYVVKRGSDYAGSTTGRDYEPLGAKGLLQYVDENRIEIDKSIKEMKRLHPELNPKPGEKKVETQDDDGR